jgi:hypothetical protein
VVAERSVRRVILAVDVGGDRASDGRPLRAAVDGETHVDLVEAAGQRAHLDARLARDRGTVLVDLAEALRGQGHAVGHVGRVAVAPASPARDERDVELAEPLRRAGVVRQ